MKVLLVSVYSKNMVEKLEEPGISLIASYLRSKGEDVTLITANDSTDCSTFLEYEPTIIGMNMYNVSRDIVINISKKLKRLAPDVYIVVGGVEATYHSKQIMIEASNNIDFIIRGEGEVTFFRIIDAIKTGTAYDDIDGITYRYNGEIIETHNACNIGSLDDMPYAARDLLYRNNLSIAQISTSRGCTGNCSFCASPSFWKKWRGRSARNIIGEIKELYSNGIRMINFVDSSFEDPDESLARMVEIVDEIIESKLTISYFADFRGDFHKRATSQVMDKLSLSGLCSAMIGVETNNEYDLKLYRKKATLVDNEKTINLFRSYAIPVKLGFINFNPYSNYERIMSNATFLRRHSLVASLESLASRLYVYKNTPIYWKLKKDGILLEEAHGEIKYRFTEPYVYDLYNYINSYMRQPGKIGYFFNEIKLLCIYYKIILKNLEIQFKHSDKERNFLFDFNQKNSNKMNQIIADINDLVYEWFVRLCDMINAKWEQNEADNITVKYLNDKILEEQIKQANRIKRTLFKGVIGLNPKNELYILNDLKL